MVQGLSPAELISAPRSASTMRMSSTLQGMAIASISTMKSGCDSRRTSMAVLVGNLNPKYFALTSACLKNSSMSVT